MPQQLAAIGQPVSVCHQWSITGRCELLLRPAQRVGIAALAGEEQRAKARQVVALPMWRPFGSSFLIARNAVGAVNSATTPCCAITRQNAPGSGVPTGLPS